MLLHRLSVTAFGPFAGTETVDFDTLNDQGIFLLTGPTGSGKTSILDAVCFALYGEVPGARGTTKSLRSHHAAEGAEPLVELEVTVGGRRFRILRSPWWMRPKKRGSGHTPDNAKVVLAEHVDGEWRELSTRIDETAQLLRSVLGLSADQFTQVAMLPQGAFQKFLHAGTDERQSLLERLFRTERFSAVQSWLGERRRALGQANGKHRERANEVVSRIAEAAAVDLPEAWKVGDLTQQAESGELADWFGQLVDACDLRLEESASALEVAQARRSEAEKQSQQADERAALRARHAQAAADIASLEESEQEAQALRSRLEDSARAEALVPLLDESQDAAEALQAASSSAAVARQDLAPDLGREPGQIDAETLTDALESALREETRAKALEKVEVGLLEAQQVVDDVVTASQALQLRRQSLASARETLPHDLETARAALSASRDSAAKLPGLASAVQTLTRQLQAATDADSLEASLGVAVDERQAAEGSRLAAVDHLQSVRGRRLEGMAAELAGALAAGEPCPVCGSPAHPSPAVAAADAPTEHDESAAQASVDEATRLADEAKGREQDILRGLEVARAASDGLPAATLAERLAEAERTESESRAVAAEATQREAEVQRLESLSASIAEDLSRVEVEEAELNERRKGAERDLEAHRAELGVALGDAPTVAVLQTRISQRVERLRRGQQALTDLAAASVRHERAAAQLSTQTAARGFADADAARAALLPQADNESLRAQLEERTRRRAAADATITDPAVTAAVAAPADDPEAILAELELATLEWTARSADHAAAKALQARLIDLGSELKACLDAWAPERSAYAVADRMARLADGTSGDNAPRMTLATFVLSERLASVVAAANTRLGPMQDHRYVLEQTDERSSGRSRGGLGLRVIDAWSGEPRTPQTLSGGETFIVSLALALGLADVVAAEAGGTDIDTLFVDEGFGSLDADSLDSVMDTLDGLREGGRVVGLVSHVSEMRSRIPTQVRVSKSRTGSHVGISGTDGSET